MGLKPKIACYLSVLDTKIESVASATLSLQQWKKGLLQQLLI
jgi:restriction endonuclease S subunit